MRDLVREGDVFSQGCRQGALERQSFGPIELAQLRPGIMCTAINCYGHEGPWRTRPGWEQLGQTVTGMAVVHGGAEGPRLQPGAVTDYTTGFPGPRSAASSLCNTARSMAAPIWYACRLPKRRRSCADLNLPPKIGHR
ncbi:MAG: CoA transferase [Rhizomicrobium sp.]